VIKSVWWLEIKSASLSHRHYAPGETMDEFIVYFWDSSTRVTISLPSIPDIEKVFNVFDENSERFRINIPKKPFAFSNQTIPSNFARKELLSRLEEYITKKAIELDPDQGELSKSYYGVTIHKPGEIQNLNSIKEFPLDYFPNNTQSINLKYDSRYQGNLKISIGFASKRASSELEINYKGENPSSVVNSIRSDILDILKDYKCLNSLYHPSEWITFILTTIIFTLLLISFTIKDIIIKWIIIGFIALIGVYNVSNFFKPYCVLETKRNEEYMRWSKFLVEGFIAFLFFGILGGFVLKLIGL